MSDSAQIGAYSTSPVPPGFYKQVAELVWRSGCILLAIFLVNVAVQAFPIRLFDPAWQYRLCANLVDQGGFALTGFVMLHLAALRSYSSYGPRLNGVRRLAMLAVIGYLLLIPLLATSLWRGYSQMGDLASRQRKQAGQSILQLRSAIQSASTTEELQKRLASLQAPPIPPTMLNQPLPRLKEGMLATLKNAESSIPSGAIKPPDQELGAVIRLNLRHALLSLLLAAGFGFGSKRRKSRFTLL